MNQLLKGDCRDHLRSLANNSVDLIIADPPYNVYENEVVKMTFQRRKKDVTWDQFDANFMEFSMEWLELCTQKLKKTGSLFIFGGVNYMKGNDLLSLLPMLRQKMQFVNMIVWYYHNGYGSRRFFSNRYELIGWFSKSRKYKFNLDAVRIPYDEKTLAEYLKDKRLNPENVMKGKNPTNVWQIGRINGNEKSRTIHPTQKPEEIIERIILSTTDKGDLVVDPFLGSGTTMKVCQNLDRNCIGMEINPEYFPLIEKRCHLENLEFEISQKQRNKEIIPVELYTSQNL